VHATDVDKRKCLLDEGLALQARHARCSL